MIKHIVMWKLHSAAAGYSGAENAERIRDRLLQLPEKIPQIKHFEVGVNINRGDHAFDLVLYSKFRTLEDLQIYQNHPEHQKFKEFISDLRSEIHFIDYEI